ncbi:MAG: hypothetical protein ONB44_09575 [candidate division KSB1 bacterium]|nr:hypothetical protein [candidate division KSB1 bacterium]MDZ7302378.1 hypothetical protein [candidate division KSB1 bacterium]
MTNAANLFKKAKRFGAKLFKKPHLSMVEFGLTGIPGLNGLLFRTAF